MIYIPARVPIELPWALPTEQVVTLVTNVVEAHAKKDDHIQLMHFVATWNDKPAHVLGQLTFNATECFRVIPGLSRELSDNGLFTDGQESDFLALVHDLWTNQTLLHEIDCAQVTRYLEGVAIEVLEHMQEL